MPHPDPSGGQAPALHLPLRTQLAHEVRRVTAGGKVEAGTSIYYHSEQRRRHRKPIAARLPTQPSVVKESQT